MPADITWDVVVIGGGPAGMMAAGKAGMRGKKVLLLEKNSSLGKKLLITGGGRCNVTNNKPNVRVMLEKYKDSAKFLFSAFSQFGVKEAIEFFHHQGMDMHEENEGRLFPLSNKARSVFDVMVRFLKDGKVTVQSDSEVKGIVFDTKTDSFVIKLKQGDIRARSCVVATGGLSHPETGSTGDGFIWLKRIGHTIIDHDMSLVPIALKTPWVKKIAGVTLQNIRMTTFVGDKKQKAYDGKVLFTHFGISGPTVLNMSRDVGRLIEDSKYANTKGDSNISIQLDIFPRKDISEIKNIIQELLREQSNKKIKNSLSFLVTPGLVPCILELANINGDTFGHSVTTEERKRLVITLKSILLSVSGLLGREKAVISSGGVALTEVNFKTMESRLAPRLFLVGDVLNIDRPSGGYSLQLCWTTGYVAGSNC